MMICSGILNNKRPLRAAGAALSFTLLLPACQGGGSAASLSPQQQLLREQSQRWNQTALTGAGIGVLGGAAAGAAMDKNRAEGALIGAGVGLLSGLLAGAVVATRNLDFERRELSAVQRIEAAQQIAYKLDQAASTSERVAYENRQKLARLDRQFHAAQITSTQYESEAKSMRQDIALMRKTAAEARDARERLLQSSKEVPQLRAEERPIASAQRRLTSSANELEDALHRFGLERERNG